LEAPSFLRLVDSLDSARYDTTNCQVTGSRIRAYKPALSLFIWIDKLNTMFYFPKGLEQCPVKG
jgi:hypothetical protein